MSFKTDDFDFDPDKTAIENLFALIHRTNRVKLTPAMVDVEPPVAIPDDEHGDNTTIVIKQREGSPVRLKGTPTLYYARADIDHHYPDFSIDIEELEEMGGKEALKAFIDGNFNLVDSEFDLDIDDPFGSFMTYTGIDIVAKPESYIYIGRKTINLFWSGGERRIDEDGLIRVTDEGFVRIRD